jgi:hypothetical protein
MLPCLYALRCAGVAAWLAPSRAPVLHGRLCSFHHRCCPHTASARAMRSNRTIVSMGKGLSRKKAFRQKASSPPASQQSAVAAPSKAALNMLEEETVGGPERHPTSAEGYQTLFTYYQKVAAPKQLLVKAEEARSKALLSPALLAYALKAELEMGRADLAHSLLSSGSEADARQWAAWLAGAEPSDTIALIRAACRANEPQLAQDLMALAGVLVPAKCSDGSAAEAGAAVLSPAAAATAAVLYPSLVSAWFRCDRRAEALATLEAMAQGRIAADVDALNRLVRGAQLRRDLVTVFAVLDAMTAARVAANDATYEVTYSFIDFASTL